MEGEARVSVEPLPHFRNIHKCHKEGKPFFIWYNTTGMHFRTHCAEKHKGKSGQGAAAPALSLAVKPSTVRALSAFVRVGSLTQLRMASGR